jgi:hypothetical protein
MLGRTQSATIIDPDPAAMAGSSDPGLASAEVVEVSAEIKTAYLFNLDVILQPAQDFGRGPLGRRILFGAASGKFQGPRLQGDVLAGGGDWALFRADGVMSLDVRLTLRTHDGALIQMTYGGRWTAPAELRKAMWSRNGGHELDPAGYYFRTNPLFETGSEAYAWLNEVVAVGTGYRTQGGVGYNIFQVL